MDQFLKKKEVVSESHTSSSEPYSAESETFIVSELRFLREAIRRRKNRTKERSHYEALSVGAPLLD